jgi:hypothetical protein
MNKGGPHIEALPKRTSLYLKIEEVNLDMVFKRLSQKKSHYSFDVGQQQQQPTRCKTCAH